MKKINFIAMALIASAMFVSCANEAVEQPQKDADASVGGTRVGNSKIVSVYVETNDVNPLNALCYVKTGTTTPFVDRVTLFAANMNKDAATGDPTLYFNKELRGYMDNYATYVKPLQDAGIKVLLGILPNWQGIGFCNLTPTQATDYAELVAWAVYTYGLDGVMCDQEYPGTTATVSGSYGNFIKALRAEFNAGGLGKLIHVFQWGGTSVIGSSQIDATAGAMIDLVDHGSFGAGVYASSSITGVTTGRFIPVAVQLGNSYSDSNLKTIRRNAAKVVSQGYAGVMGFNLRCGSDVDASPVLSAWAQGFNGISSTLTALTPRLVEWNGTCYPEGPEVDPGITFTKADIQ